MKKILSLSLLTSTLLFSSNISIDSIGVNLGNSNSDYKQVNHQGSIILGNTPDKSFNSIELYTTLNPLSDICKEYNMKPYVSYTYSSNDDLKHQYLLLGLNKYYNHNNYELYAGLLGGYGQMNWKYDPLNNSKSKKIDANSFIAGLQLGVNYSVNDKVSLGLNTKYLVHNYETNLNPTAGVSATIEHKSTSTIMLGLSYKF